MNGLVLCSGANKTVGSLEFSKTRLQPLVKPTKREQLLLELELKHDATGGGGGGGVGGGGGDHCLQNRNSKYSCSQREMPNPLTDKMQRTI